MEWAHTSDMSRSAEDQGPEALARRWSAEGLTDDDDPGGCWTWAGALLRAAGGQSRMSSFSRRAAVSSGGGWLRYCAEAQGEVQGLAGRGSLCDRDFFTCRMRGTADLRASQGWCF